MEEKVKRTGGWKEGVARGISQACVYAIEARKSAYQVGIRGLQTDVPRFLRGMMESAISSGFIFGMYFTTYNSLGGPQNLLASPAATFVTSLVKIPISNCIRLRQVGYAENLVGATRRIIKLQGPRGLYAGYALSVIEDMIEFDLRIRLYNALRKYADSTTSVPTYVGLGAVAGMTAAYVTSPFDTIRANMTVTGQPAIACIADIFKRGGATGFYKGAHLRMASNGVKYGLFFMIYEALNLNLG